MKAKEFLSHFALAFSVTFVVNAIVVYLWNLIRHGEGVFEWDTAFFFAMTFGLVLPLSEALRSKK